MHEKLKQAISTPWATHERLRCCVRTDWFKRRAYSSEMVNLQVTHQPLDYQKFKYVGGNSPLPPRRFMSAKTHKGFVHTLSQRFARPAITFIRILLEQFEQVKVVSTGSCRTRGTTSAKSEQPTNALYFIASFHKQSFRSIDRIHLLHAPTVPKEQIVLVYQPKAAISKTNSV
ncbi:Hypothetical_protein [Hexamita inflata]|uniref:Hypothetical_protein n=1 Tax=Hexamita inflata TaxID=28002 RepID=A0AA86NNU8_9EUKA|nr:Hypothetical protein HINF_LOCUS10477 [Hexamita inflata]